MNEIYVLDACSVIALLREEEGHERVVQLLNQVSISGITVMLHKITLTEITYDLLRSGAYVNAADIHATCYKLPVVPIDDLTDSFICVAAQFKVTQRISFADCFVLALAKTRNATVVTADHHEFDAIEKNGDLTFHWIR